jgi:hypothetical protein
MSRGGQGRWESLSCEDTWLLLSAERDCEYNRCLWMEVKVKRVTHHATTRRIGNGHVEWSVGWKHGIAVTAGDSPDDWLWR